MLRLGAAAAAVGAWRELRTDELSEPLDTDENGRLEETDGVDEVTVSSEGEEPEGCSKVKAAHNGVHV